MTALHAVHALPFHRLRRAPAPCAQRGAATLVVVMVLFFVMSLAAAYASRNLIFEQRTSANQLRSTQAFDAAEAGLEWAVAMLNSGRIDDNCEPTTDTTKDTFRQRYLTYTGLPPVTPLPPPGALKPVEQSPGVPLWAACTLDGTTWRCVCPATALAAGSLPVSGPAFALRFVAQLDKPGMVRVEVNGCNSYELTCVQAGNVFQTNICQSTLCSLLALHSGAKNPPAAAVTARTTITGSALQATNASRAAGGMTLQYGLGPLGLTPTLTSLPGRPGSESTRLDTTLASDLTVDSDTCTYCLFTSVFGLRRATYHGQGAAIELDCSTACTATQVNAALDSARSRIVVLRNGGGLALNASTDIIGDADPVVLAIEGPLTINSTAAGSQIFGLVYAGSATLAAGEIHGALVSASTIVSSGTTSITYDEDRLRKLKLTSGSFVRVPGAWRDFP